MAKLSLTLLGGFQARLDAGSVLALPTRKAQALLAYLALPAGRAHPRDKLAALLWGGIREESSRASLRQALFSLRRGLSEDAAAVLRQDGDLVALSPAVVDVDVADFERAVAAGSTESLAHAADTYGGDLLAGLTVDEPPFEEWLLAERERLRELALEGLAKLLAHQRGAGVLETAVQTALKLLALDPLQEPVHRVLMRLYADLGRRAAALRQYQLCVSVLARELGAEPEAQTKALYQDILRQRTARSTAADAVMLAGSTGASEHRAPGASHDTTLLGRADELEALCRALPLAPGGDGRVVAVLGEAGIGKSRLVGELAIEAVRGGATVLVGRSYESEQILPFGPWVDALRAGGIGQDVELLERLGATLRAELARLLPETGQPPTGSVADVRPVFESVAQVIGLLAGRKPLLVILEDVHWADEMSSRLVAFVGRRLAGRRVLLVATAREEELADLQALRQVLGDLRRDGLIDTLTLSPLSRPDTIALVRAITRGGDDAAVERLGEQIWVVSEGNPFVAVETARAHAEGAAVGSGRDVALPERVRDVVGRRLERLSERGQSLAAVAAVIGREFEFALLQRAAALGEEETAAGVEELVRRRVLHGLGERFDFTHDRIREVASGRILAPRRKLIHRRVAEAIEALYAPDLQTHEVALGLHYRGAEVWDRAADHLYKAGCAAGRERVANREAAACFVATLQCLRRLPEDAGRSERIIDTLVEQEAALMGLGEFRRSLEGLREAEALARGLGDRLRLGWIFGRFAYNLGSIGDLDGALENAEQARIIGVETGDARAQSTSNVMLARAWYARGDYRRVMESVRENDLLDRRVILEGHARGNMPFSRGWGVLALAELGEFAEGIAQAEEALRVAPAQFGRHSQVWAHLSAGRLYVVKGDLERSIEVLELGLPLCETASDLSVYFSRMAAALGAAYALSGRLDEALPLLERADRHAESIGFAYGHGLVVATLAEAKLLAGNIEGAARDAERAHALSRQHGQHGWEAWTLRLQGEIAARRDCGDIDGASPHFLAASALAHERSMKPLLAHCRLGLGAILSRAGQLARGRAEIAAALDEYRAMDMPYWKARAEAELANVSP